MPGPAAADLLIDILARLPQGAKRNAVFRADVVRDTMELADARVAALGPDALRVAEGVVARRRRSTEAAEELARFSIVVAALKRTSPPPEVAHRLMRHGLSCLQRAAVTPDGSRLAHLHTELRAAMSLAVGGQSWATALAAAAHADARYLCATAERTMLEEGAEPALVRLLEEEAASAPERSLGALHLARARVLRLSGKFDDARAVLEGAAEGAFERACVEAMRTGDLEALFAALRAGALSPTPDERAVLHLWTHATPKKSWMKLGARPSALKRLGAHPALVRATELVERLYTKTTPLSGRIDLCGRLCDLTEELPGVAGEALVLAAAARWLFRSKQHPLATIPARRYRALCSTLSEGRSVDLFSFGLEEIADGRREPDGDEDASDRPRASFSSAAALDPNRRGLDYIRLGLSLLATAADGGGEDRATAYAKILTDHLRVLKGPAMKLGQMIGFYGLPLPLEATEALSTLHSDAQPIAFRDIEERFESEQRRTIGEAFDWFEEVPFAVGSVGQVHLARTKRGATVAVKALFPGIETSIRRDFRSLRLVLPLLRMWMPHWEWPALADELEERMIGECDLVREAATQSAFRKQFEDDAAVVVPRVFEAESSKGILVSEFFRGQPLAAFLAESTLAQRERAAETVARYVITTVFAGTFNTDLHPGNLLFDGDSVCVLDFGSVRRWTAGEQKGWRWMLESMVRNDRELLRRGLEITGHCGGDLTEEALAETHRALLDNLMTFVASETPCKVDKRSVLNEIRAFGPSGGFGRFQMRIPPSYVYAFRIYWGCFSILSDLDVAIAARPIVERVLADIDAAALA